MIGAATGSHRHLPPALVGVPYEEGTYWRKGTKHGPARIREHLRKLRGYSLSADRSVRHAPAEIDRGDLQLDQYDHARAFRQIEDAIASVLADGRAPVVIGGDHSITLPIVRALARRLGAGSFGIIHLDAHSDTFDPVDGFRYHHGAAFRNIVEEGLVVPRAIHQLGIRGQVRDGGLQFVETTGIHCVRMRAFRARGASIAAFVADRSLPYYVSIDIDVVDPAFAPGTGTPVPGGMTSAEILDAMIELRDYQVIGLDLVEVAPPYDSSEITSVLAANLIHEALANIDFVG
jgi:agmatinase